MTDVRTEEKSIYIELPNYPLSVRGARILIKELEDAITEIENRDPRNE